MSSEIPVAIIGLGGRFPSGSNTAAQFYDFLRNKVGGEKDPGKYHTAKGGFIHDIDMFDPFEFGISTKEASHSDVAIRLALEASHQALQDSGIDYRGSKTGVYFGNLLSTTFEVDDDRFERNSYNSIGKCVSIRANRISFTFDLRGPSLTVDTACSASATAMHLALSAIRSGEIDQALVVGANTMINPELTVAFSKLGVLSPTGSSKSFDASADGYARAEATAAAVIKRQDLVERDGDLVYAVITGSSINANGTGMSLTMPEGAMQAETIKGAYALAKRDPSEAFYVELHATGTKVGDPIEANAAGQLFSVNRPNHKLLRIGSVKSNIGHTEGCSFLASLVKVSMMLYYREIIPNIRFDTPNPGIDFLGGKLRVQTELERLSPKMAAEDGKWVASISSYGVGGSNAHVVLESSRSVFESNGEASSHSTAELLYLFFIGTLTEASLVRWQETLCTAFQGTRDHKSLSSISYQLSRQSRSCPTRCYAVAPFLDPDTKFSAPVLVNNAQNPKLCLVFSGQGPQHIYMGRQLAATYPVFLNSICESDRILVERYNQESVVVRTGLFIPGRTASLASNGTWPVNEIVLSVVFFQIALVDLLESLGVQYDFVVGHSLGEIAMGYASGHYSRELAIGIAVARAAAMMHAEGNGSMVALGVGIQKAKAMIRKVLRQAGVDFGLWIAGINSPEAVTVAGKHELIDGLIKLAKNATQSVFAAKLRVGCAFHTPLMQAQEELFKTYVSPIFADATGRNVGTRVMSTNDGKWLDRDLDMDYCWDNIRRPVLFGTAIKKLIDEHGDRGLIFLEIAPHPVLKSYVEQCGGQAISLIRRPNHKLPSESTGEQAQLLEGIGELLAMGFKHIELRKLCASTVGYGDFTRVALPDYPYNRTRCWAESGSERSMRLLSKRRPLAPAHFRINIDSHPDLGGHMIFDAPLFPASGYIESILENGAMVVQDVTIHKPLILKGHDTIPTHAGCIVDGHRWQFRASTTDEFDNGSAVLDTVYASGTFWRVNPGFRADMPLMFDIASKLAHSCGSVTGDEFYCAILASAYQYKGHFRDYLQEVHEITDEASWGGKAYLARLEVPEGTPDVFGRGYVIHPGILDTITQCALAMFINMATKLFDFNGTFLPVKIEAVRRWDSTDAPDLDDELKEGIWTWFTSRTWAPLGPFKSDYVVVNSQGRVLLTMEGFEFALVPRPDPLAINDQTPHARLTTVWQPKAFPSSDRLRLGGVSFSSAFETIIKDAAKSGRRVFRVLDVDETAELAPLLNSTLITLSNDHQLHIEYYCGGLSRDVVNTRVVSMSYGHVRPFIVDSWASGDVALQFGSFDLLLGTSGSPVCDLARLDGLIVPSGIVLIVPSGKMPARVLTSPEPSSLMLSFGFLASHTQMTVQSGKLLDNRDIVAIRLHRPFPSHPLTSNTVVIHPFTQGHEDDLMSVVKYLTPDCELWISGDDDAAGIGAMGVAACLIAEFPEFKVHSILFEDHVLSQEAREGVIHDIRRQPPLLEHHMKVSMAGEVYVRRLVYGPPTQKQVLRPPYSLDVLPSNSKEREVKVKVVGLESSSSLATFVGVTSSSEGKNLSAKVVGLCFGQPAGTLVVSSDILAALPDGMSEEDAARVPLQLLEAWISLKSVGNMSTSSKVLIHGGGTVCGRGAIQLCRYFGVPYLCTVDRAEEAALLVQCYDASEKAVLLYSDYRTSAAVDKVGPLTVVLDCSGEYMCSLGVNKLSAAGWYIRVARDGKSHADLPRAPFMFHLNMRNVLQEQSEMLLPALKGLLAAHQSRPFDIQCIDLEAETSHDYPRAVNKDGIRIARPLVSPTTDATSRLFNPAKSYVLVGGCSELGVRISEWMVTLGARHIFLTSRRGAAGLSKVDQMYLHFLRLSGAEVEVIAADATSDDATATVVLRARESGKIGGVFLMTVVLRDAKFENLSQNDFADVRQSKVDALSTLLRCLDPVELDFLLLFSTIGSVFGNVGQAAYCAPQLYLDRMADVLPNTFSISLPPITDSGMFKRLVLSGKSIAHTQQLSNIGMTTAQVCNFIGDCLVRSIPHYVPMLGIEDVPRIFPACEPSLYRHLLLSNGLEPHASSADDQTSVDTPATLLAGLVGLEVSQITNNALMTSFGLDSIGATRYSNLLKSRFGIEVSQLELLGTMSVAEITKMMSKMNTGSVGGNDAPTEDDGKARYGSPLVPILNRKLAFDEPYTTDASPHQYRIWLAQHENDVARSAVASSKFGNSWRQALQWDTHEGYMVTAHFKEPLSKERLEDALQEIVQRHGALRTVFSWNEELAKLEQTVYPSVEVGITFHDLSSELNASAKAYELSTLMNGQPNFSLGCPPLLQVSAFDYGGSIWALSVIIHHIVIDEASVAVFLSELFHLYVNGPDSLPDMKIHYSDFSDWLVQTSVRREELKREQLRFWGEFLQDLEPLHCSLATPSVEPLATITQIDTSISEGILTRFFEITKAAHATAFAVFFAVYNVLLHKYTNQVTFAVGTTVTQRTFPSLSNVIGMFANVLPIKTIIREDELFVDYLARFKETVIACLANGDVGYEDIVASGKTFPHQRGYFKHLFSVGGLDAENLYQLENDSIRSMGATFLPNHEQHYEFLLTVHPKTGHVVLRFDRHSFTEQAARQFLDAYTALVGSLAKDPEITIRDICMLEESQRDRLLKDFAGESTAPMGEQCLHHLFEQQVARTPSFTAVEFEGESLTYLELNTRADALAQVLVDEGVHQDDIVAVCFDRGIPQILAIMSVLKIGASFVPLDPDDSALRKREILQDCSARILLTSSDQSSGDFGTVQVTRSSVFPNCMLISLLAVCVDHHEYGSKNLAVTDIATRAIDGRSAAYIMFTSGSTGKPKGVVVEHRSICNLVRNSEVYGFREGTRVLSSLSYTFDPFIVDVFGTLTKGGTLVTGRKEMVLGNIPVALRDLCINVLHVTPSILSTVPVDDYPRLETVVVAGEELPKQLINDWAGRVTLRNMYGPTEASVDCTSYQITPSSVAGDIGRPLPNNRIYILDKYLRPVPIGVEGHLYVGGIQLARGYLNQPELTAQVFIANPFVPGERIYKTGDIALFRPDGTIHYRGREDRQVKLRGQRIELTAVEDVVSLCPVVRRCAVMIHTVHSTQALVAYLEFSEAGASNTSNAIQILRSSVKNSLPLFMHPAIFVPLPILPTTSSGKVNRRALLELNVEAHVPDATDVFALPQSSLESEVLSIFSRIIRTTSSGLGVTFDLFNAGMTSLMAVQASGELFNAFGVHISLREIYTRPTIRELADLIGIKKSHDPLVQGHIAEVVEVISIKQAGAEPKVFFIHDVTGLAVSFNRLAPFLPNELYAIQDCHFGSAEGFPSMDAMAEHYVELIKNIQPSGPYIICGHSFGGLVALCMTTQLLRAGEQVKHLIFLDSVYVPCEVRDPLRTSDWKHAPISRLLANADGVTEDWMHKLEVEISRNMDLMLDYDPEHYPGSVTLVVPEDRSWYLTGGATMGAFQLTDDNGWRRRVGKVAIYVTAGRHDTLLSEENSQETREGFE
ncbi:putative nonribosomal peptide synthetase [Melanogaster broomeanus]|nr:putative nonribosomal peptide synthetase [Melanogaster broomeanus]